MRKKFTLMLVASLVLTTSYAPTVCAQEVAGIEESPTTVLPITGNYLSDEIQPPSPSEPDGIIGGHEYVDLGLPSGTLWATYNVGATTPYEGGLLFAWGEVEPKDDFSWENYIFFIEHYRDQDNGTYAVLEDIGENICGTKYDAARHQWGNGWRLPNSEELYELRMLCWNKWTTENGVKGYRIYGPNEHSIFLPVCKGGLWYGVPDPFNGEESAYWSGAEEPETGFNGRQVEPSNRAKVIYVQYGGLQTSATRKAYFNNIRAVVNPRETGIDNGMSDYRNTTLIYHKGCIQVLGNHAVGQIKVFDMSGRMAYSGAVMNGICQIPELAAGIYLVSYTNSGDPIITQKIAIK